MPTIHVEAQLTLDELIRAVQQLSASEFEQFTSNVLALRAERAAPSVSAEETDLLLKINRGLPPDVQQRFDELIVKRQAESLSPDEHTELLTLSNEAERIQAERIENLAALARLRKISLTALMEQLGIRAPSYA